MGRLTALSVKTALKRVGRHGDGDGLFLEVKSAGAASWIVRVQKSGKRRDFGLGSAKKVSLAQARERAADIRSQLEAGVDPIAARRKTSEMPTFQQAAALVFAANLRNWKNGKHQQQWIRTLETFAFPSIGNTRVGDVTAAQVHDLLAAIWLERPETARRVRQRVGMILDWAYSKGYRSTEAPMRSITKGLPRQSRKASHLAAMPYVDVPAFLIRLQDKETWGRLALEAAILTGCRSGEIRGATWDEIDLKADLWTIPKERMKAGREHVVPLSPAALKIFNRAAELRVEGVTHIFPGLDVKKPMSDMTLMKVLRDMGEPFTVHGFRSSFRDWISEETNHPSEIAEAALAHAVADKTEAAYRRGNLLEKRRKLMNDWGRFCRA